MAAWMDADWGKFGGYDFIPKPHRSTCFALREKNPNSRVSPRQLLGHLRLSLYPIL